MFKSGLIQATIALALLSISPFVKADLKEAVAQDCYAYNAGKDASTVNACKLYIDGFIDALLLAEAATKADLDYERAKRANRSSFTERAYRTRLFTRVGEDKKLEKFEICLPSTMERAEIVSTVAKSMKIEQIDQRPLKQVMMDTLETLYSCSENK